jgi:hypothetical protein
MSKNNSLNPGHPIPVPSHDTITQVNDKTYTRLKETIKANHLDNYYILLLLHSKQIVDETLNSKHHIVAKQLNLTPARFSYIFPLLVAGRDLLDISPSLVEHHLQSIEKED